jgi:dimethylargininase
VNPTWINPESFPGWDLIEIAPGEEHAANALLVGETVLYPAAFPLTAQRLRDAGIQLEVVDLSELAKAEGAVTCCSLIFRP